MGLLKRWISRQSGLRARSYASHSSHLKSSDGRIKIMAAIENSIFTPATAARFDKLATIYPVKRSALVPMLLYAQDEVGYVSEDVVNELAARLDLLPLDVRNVLSYYSMLRTAPVGKFNVQVCTNISCMLRGGFELLDHCKKTLGVGHKETTPDGLFSLEEVECIGACCWAPAVQVNYDFHEDLSPEKRDAVLDTYRAKAV
jgi:NADH-quinone oxidoreductase subunit E